MSPRPRLIFLLRAVLACALLWIAAPQVGSASAQRAEIVLVSGAPGARCDQADPSAPRRRTTRGCRARSWLTVASRALASSKPSLGTDTLVLIEDRYLRHLAILC